MSSSSSALGVSLTKSADPAPYDGEVGQEETPLPESNIMVTNNSRIDWSKLLFQEGYFEVLKQMALSGELQRSNMRAICWKLFLGCLPEDRSQWVSSSRKSRESYAFLHKKYVVDPHSTSTGNTSDLTVNNPLSLAEESPWNQFFQDEEIKQTIVQDIVRTHPDQLFFKQQKIQDSMLEILFFYAKEHPDLTYRQGMHELLAPILFVLHAESREDITHDQSLTPELREVMDPEYINADAFWMFSELMEGMQQFYVNAILEADFHRNDTKSKQAMQHDPRTTAPFEESVFPTSSISRKLDKIQEVLLKRADEALYDRFNDLGIPPQTYGIRWIRLLFGREFDLPNVLQLWDALFAEGTSLSLIDYVFVAMLLAIRETLLSSDYSTCMQALMHYPSVYEVSDLVQSALHIRSPGQHPRLHAGVNRWGVGPTSISPPPGFVQVQLPHESSNKAQKFASKTKQAFTNKLQAIPTKQIHLPTKRMTPRPAHAPFPAQGSPSSFAGTREEGAPVMPKMADALPTHKAAPTVSVPEQEMVKNPKTRPRAASYVERLSEQLENTEAKCLYCGRKMESFLDELQTEVESIDLTPQQEDTIFVALAGLKQVRDLLLHKLPFSGELPDYENLTLTDYAHPGLPRIVRNENSANPPVHSNPPHPLMPEAGSDHQGDI